MLRSVAGHSKPKKTVYPGQLRAWPVCRAGFCAAKNKGRRKTDALVHFFMCCGRVLLRIASVAAAGKVPLGACCLLGTPALRAMLCMSAASHCNVVNVRAFAYQVFPCTLNVGGQALCAAFIS
jgi:hypothetical protein